MHQSWCFKAPPAGGVVPELSGDTSHLVVWDSSGCPDKPGFAFVHYAGKGPFVPIYATVGDTVHSLHAAYYDTLPTSETGCQKFTQAAHAYRKDAVVTSDSKWAGRLDFSIASGKAVYPQATCHNYGRPTTYNGPIPAADAPEPPAPPPAATAAATAGEGASGEAVGAAAADAVATASAELPGASGA